MGEWMEVVNLEVVNRGGAPTFVRINSHSHIYVTLSSVGLLTSIEEWAVREEENFYHKNITYSVVTGKRRTPNGNRGNGGWKLDDTGLNGLARAIPRFFGDERQRRCTAEECRSLLTRACDATLPPKRNETNKNRGVYWWTEEIAELRRECPRARRRITRRTRIENPEEMDIIVRDYRNRRKDLRTAIRREKYRYWKKLVEKLETDVWGPR